MAANITLEPNGPRPPTPQAQIDIRAAIAAASAADLAASAIILSAVKDVTDGLHSDVATSAEWVTVKALLVNATASARFTADVAQSAANSNLSPSDIVNDLTTGGATSVASGETVRTLKVEVDALVAILEADDVDLDTAQERLDYIKNLSDEIDGLAVSDIAGLQSALGTKAEVETLARNSKVEADNASTYPRGKISFLYVGAAGWPLAVEVGAPIGSVRTDSLHRSSQLAIQTFTALTGVGVGKSYTRKSHNSSAWTPWNREIDSTEFDAKQTEPSEGAFVDGDKTKLDLCPTSDTTAVGGSSAITNMISLTQAEYDTLPARDEPTLYIITEEQQNNI